VIANVVPELAVVFETKERAPFKVVFEILRLSELEKMSSEAEKAGSWVLFPTEGTQPDQPKNVEE
jgi:hypothetical protein